MDRLETYALALHSADATWLMTVREPPSLKALIVEAKALRELLFLEVQLLAKRELINPRALRSLRGAQGMRNLSADLMLLGEWLRRLWPELQARTSVRTEELLRAAQLVRQFADVIGTRRLKPERAKAAADERHRAFTLFVRCYDLARRVAVYLRYDEGDADNFVVPLYAGRGNGGRKRVAHVEVTPEGVSD